MNYATLRKEVRLLEEIVDEIQEYANEKKWSLKKAMEEILTEFALKEKNKKTNQIL
jgi:hypothetical protein